MKEIKGTQKKSTSRNRKLNVERHPNTIIETNWLENIHYDPIIFYAELPQLIAAKEPVTFEKEGWTRRRKKFHHHCFLMIDDDLKCDLTMMTRSCCDFLVVGQMPEEGRWQDCRFHCYYLSLMYWLVVVAVVVEAFGCKTVQTTEDSRKEMQALDSCCGTLPAYSTFVATFAVHLDCWRQELQMRNSCC